MSTFSGLNTALSGLNAARTGLNTVGQNLTNVNTAGYTRQRVDLAGAGVPARGALNDAGTPVGQGVRVTGVTRFGDTFLDGRVHTAFASAGYASVRADALSGIQDTLGEPGDTGISSQLNGFWGAWQEVHNYPGEAGPSSVLLQKATGLVQSIASGYRALDGQWSRTRDQAAAMVADVNATATAVATLNERIRAAQAAGTPANDLIDQRGTLTEHLADLAGGTARDAPDGTVEVLVGGNALVSGKQANTLKLTGAAGMADGAPVTLEWERHPGVAAGLDGGRLAGALSVLAPAGDGGAIAQTAAAYNALAAKLANAVNGAITANNGVTPGGGPTDFFSLQAGVPAALGLAVVPVGPDGIAAGTGGKDGSVADAVSQLGTGADSPDKLWQGAVMTAGMAIKAGLQQATLAGSVSASAVAAQRSNAGVDLDEENVNLLAFQHAYQAAARVMTAVDEALDTLINQTGRVGR
ncbi:flagellar hook-associated protein FlgK [Specibacter cremeus]|uniref:flagellar hook-associated protein FlgK n=1 Tax=Specibacter cremeus TaxID=1629051 RepID=UPI000F77FD5E|nr:flagellar hook-associated protein FlgK [Specibacter cremeus]